MGAGSTEHSPLPRAVVGVAVVLEAGIPDGEVAPAVLPRRQQRVVRARAAAADAAPAEPVAHHRRRLRLAALRDAQAAVGGRPRGPLVARRLVAVQRQAAHVLRGRVVVALALVVERVPEVGEASARTGLEAEGRG